MKRIDQRIVYLISGLFVLLATTANDVAAQDTTRLPARNTIFAELGGSGFLYSLNYERLLWWNGYLRLGGRAGFSFTKFKDFTNTFNPDLNTPLSLHLYAGDQNHYAEISVVQIFSNTVGFDFEQGGKTRKSNFHSGFTVGYRYQPWQGGFHARIFYNMIYEHYERIRHWGGISLGYTFQRKKQ